MKTKTTKKTAAPRKARATKAPSVFADALERIERATVNGIDLLSQRMTQLERQVTTIEQCVLPPVVPAEALETKGREQAGEVTVIPPAPVTAIVAALRGIEEGIVLIAERTQALVELQLAKPPSKPRGKKATEPVAEAEGIKNNDVVDQGAPVADPTASSVEAEVAAKGVEQVVREKAAELGVPAEVVREPVKETPPPPAAETKPNGAAVPFETIRARAVEYAQKHTKPKLIELVKKFVPAGTPDADAKLSVIPEDRRADFLKALEA